MKTESTCAETGQRRSHPAGDIPSENGYLRQLLLIAATLIVILLWFVSKDPAVETRLYAAFHPQRGPVKADISGLLKVDPPVGSRPLSSSALALVNTSLRGRTLPRLLIYVGECSSCLSGDLKQWVSDARAANLAPVLISTAPRKLALAFAKDRGLKGVPVIGNPTQEILKGLNPVFTPRAYLLDEHGTLRWLQRDPELSSRRLSSDDTFQGSLRGNIL